MPLKDTDVTVSGILLIANEVAHRAKAGQELKDLNSKLEYKYAELERANAELATFTYIMSHGLKEPLRKVYTQLKLPQFTTVF